MGTFTSWKNVVSPLLSVVFVAGNKCLWLTFIIPPKSEKTKWPVNPQWKQSFTGVCPLTCIQPTPHLRFIVKVYAITVPPNGEKALTPLRIFVVTPL